MLNCFNYDGSLSSVDFSDVEWQLRDWCEAYVAKHPEYNYLLDEGDLVNNFLDLVSDQLDDYAHHVTLMYSKDELIEDFGHYCIDGAQCDVYDDETGELDSDIVDMLQEWHPFDLAYAVVIGETVCDLENGYYSFNDGSFLLDCFIDAANKTRRELALAD